jgi:hypothetical protein
MLAAITCLFNPGNSQRRLANYCHVAAELATAGVDLWTVEATFPGQQFALTPGPRVIRYACDAGQILWQKERLLNLAVAQLPADVDAVAWLDADVLFDCCELGWAIEQALQVCPVVQAWQYAVLLGPDGQQQAWPHGVHVAIGKAAHNWELAAAGRPLDVSPRASHPGYAWAMRREAWDAMGGLYEHDLGGVGDGVMAAAWLGAGAANPYLRWASPAMRADALRWGSRAQAVVGGQVGYVPIAIGHLYHGAIQDRRYGERARRLRRYGFHPRRDLVAERGKPLRWSQAAPRELVDWCQRWLCRLQREDA